VQRLIEEKFFRMLQPHALGGAELHPVTYSMVTETLAAADGAFREAR